MIRRPPRSTLFPYTTSSDLEFVDSVNQAKLANGFAAERFVLFAFGSGKQVFAIASQHVSAQDGALHGRVGIRGIYFRHDLPGLRSAEKTEVFDRLTL